MLGRHRHLVQLDGLQHLGRRGRAAREALDQEAGTSSRAAGQLLAEPAELRGEGVVDEEDVHGRLPPAAASALKLLGQAGQAGVLAVPCAATSAAAASPSGR